MLFLLHVAAALLGLLLIFATLPLALELLCLSLAALLPYRAPDRVWGPAGKTPDPRLAVIIPAHNEQTLIAKCVASLAAPATVYVIAHNCTDDTAEQARAAGAKVLILNDTVGGKGIALDFGFRQAVEAGAEYVLVIDADSVVAPNLIAAVSAAFAAGAQALQCRYQVSNAGANRRTRLTSLAFLGINVLRPLGRHRLGLSCGIFGNGFALSAATLARVPYTPNSLVEDLEYHLHLIRAGVRVQFLNHATVFGEMPETSTAAATQRARWEGGRILMRRLWTRPLAVAVLRGRVRLLEPLLDVRALPLAAQVIALGLAIVIAFTAHLIWLAGYAAAGMFSVVLYVVVAAWLGPDRWRTLAALASAPAFLAWKILMIPRTRLAARGNAGWVRTQRNAEASPPKPPV